MRRIRWFFTLFQIVSMFKVEYATSCFVFFESKTGAVELVLALGHQFCKYKTNDETRNVGNQPTDYACFSSLPSLPLCVPRPFVLFSVVESSRFIRLTRAIDGTRTAEDRRTRASIEKHITFGSAINDTLSHCRWLHTVAPHIRERGSTDRLESQRSDEKRIATRTAGVPT